MGYLSLGNTAEEAARLTAYNEERAKLARENLPLQQQAEAIWFLPGKAQFTFRGFIFKDTPDAEQKQLKDFLTLIGQSSSIARKRRQNQMYAFGDASADVYLPYKPETMQGTKETLPVYESLVKKKLVPPHLVPDFAKGLNADAMIPSGEEFLLKKISLTVDGAPGAYWALLRYRTSQFDMPATTPIYATTTPASDTPWGWIIGIGGVVVVGGIVWWRARS
ncbi:MAG: hypothetical protein Q8O94_02740 [bacterium]|nr:hypothetical protein [bacterium]